jgi:hypothetical protein
LALLDFHPFPKLKEHLTAGHEISGLNPVARSESLAAIFSRTDLRQMPIAKLKYLVTNGDRKFHAVS